MTDETNFVVCGMDVAELKPTCELRWVDGGVNPLTMARINILEQKWVASAIMPDGGMWEEHRWRTIPVHRS